jgi:crotonobetainyl-CoA:carnitine CoA-transferase CaiB-like acyl-CoA transferase
MMRNEQVVAREVYAPVEHPVAGTIPYSQLPLRFAGAHSEPDVHAPLFGQHNREIFGGLLGLSNEEIDGLYARGVTSDAPDMATPMSSASPQRPKP